jgi:nickel transport protein
MRRTICNSSRSVQRFTTMTALLLALFLLSATAAWAHKVSVFAYVDGQNLVIDAFYSKSNKVRQGKISVQNAASGEVYLAATTDENGALSVPVPPRAIAAKADLRILLVAGEGHQNEVLVTAEEFAGLKAPAQAQPEARPADQAPRPDAKPSATKAAPAVSASGAQAAQQVTQASQLDEAALTRIVEQAVDNRMAPVKRLLLESARSGPSVTEIIGGIGYIVGLFGVAAFIAARRKNCPPKGQG